MGFESAGIAAAVLLAAGGAPTVLMPDRCYMAPESVCPIKIEPQAIDSALLKFGSQMGLDIIVPRPDLLKGLAPGLEGGYTAHDGLTRLLANTGSSYQFVGKFVVSIIQTPEPAPPRVESETSARKKVSRPGLQEVPQTPRDSGARSEVVISATRSINKGLQFTPDGVHPYVVLDREALGKASGRNVSEVLTASLTASVAGAHSPQANAIADMDSALDLRGFGFGQTLVLIDGRQVSAPNLTGDTLQPDLNGIPLSAIERIEVLPNSATPIYGGGAVGGVVNVVLRRDYEGMEAGFEYKSPFDNATNARSLHFSYGHQSQDKHLHASIFGNYSYQGSLQARERPFLLQGRESILQSFPDYFRDAPGVPLGARVNLKGLAGPLFGKGTSNIAHLPPDYRSADGLGPLLANSGTYDLGLAPSAQFGGGEASLTNVVERYGLEGMLFRDFGETITLFINLAGAARRSRAPASVWQYGGVLNTVISAEAPNNPFGQPILVSVPLSGGDTVFTSESETYRIIAGVTRTLGDKGKLTLDLTRAWTSLVLAGPESRDLSGPIYTGELDVLRDTSQYALDVSPFRQDWRAGPYDVQTQDLTVNFSGTVKRISAGDIGLDVLLQTRSQRNRGGGEEIRDGLEMEFRSIRTPGWQELDAHAARAVLTVPVFSRESALRGLRELEFQFALRRDSSSTHIVPSVDLPAQSLESSRFAAGYGRWTWSGGLKYGVFDGLTVRMTYNTGHVPPTMNELTPAREKYFGPGSFYDARRGGEAVESLVFRAGGDPGLEPEKSASTTLGVIVRPTSIPGFGATLDATFTRKWDNIVNFWSQASGSLAKYEGICPVCVERTAVAPGDPYGIGTITGITAVNVNAAEVKSFAIDAALQYEVNLSSIGKLQITSAATWTDSLELRLDGISPPQEFVGQSARNPLPFRANFGVHWSRASWGADWEARYYSGYWIDTAMIPGFTAHRVRHQQLHDFYLSYRLSAGAGSENGTELRVGLRNAANSRPRIDLGEPNYYSTIGDPWLRSYSISIRKAF